MAPPLMPKGGAEEDHSRTARQPKRNVVVAADKTHDSQHNRGDPSNEKGARAPPVCPEALPFAADTLNVRLPCEGSRAPGTEATGNLSLKSRYVIARVYRPPKLLDAHHAYETRQEWRGEYEPDPDRHVGAVFRRLDTESGYDADGDQANLQRPLDLLDGRERLLPQGFVLLQRELDPRVHAHMTPDQASADAPGRWRRGRTQEAQRSGSSGNERPVSSTTPTLRFIRRLGGPLVIDEVVSSSRDSSACPTQVVGAGGR
jgi:hypothetical protein